MACQGFHFHLFVGQSEPFGHTCTLKLFNYVKDVSKLQMISNIMKLITLLAGCIQISQPLRDLGYLIQDPVLVYDYH